MSTPGEILWSPPPDVRDRPRMGQYMQWLEQRHGLRFPGYRELWEWSVDDLEAFWSSIWEYFAIHSRTPWTQVLTQRTMPGARWFTGSTLNYAEHVLRGATSQGEHRTLVWARSQTRPPFELTAGQFADQVARIRTGLIRLGVRPGDRVAAYLPNIPETMAALLAVASLGAIWASCAPEFGTRSVLDRFRQIEPKVLLTVDGYRFGTKAIDRAAEVSGIRAELPTLEAVVALPYLEPDSHRLPGAISWEELAAEAGGLDFEPVPFDHPLYLLYSSGTTGLPKPIVHGHGNVLVEHLKAHALHHDLGPDDRFFWYTTTGWMVWNWIVSVPLTGAGVVTFDGDPASPDLGTLWDVTAETATTVLGVSAGFILGCRKAGVVPGGRADLSAVRVVLSSGSPLPAEGFRWVYESIGDHVFLASTSGGTDVCGGFVGGTPLLPVRAGEIACRCLGCKVEAYDHGGKPVIGTEGELVVTEPMPSMPVGFWNDRDGTRFRAAYFDDFPGIWRHGDWITISETGSCVISGRSDATLNRGGVRLGTSEFYSVVEGQPEITDSLVVHLEDPGGSPGELILFVVLAEGVELDDVVQKRLTDELRTTLSPRHAPDAIHAVPAIPRTLSGKKLEIPVKRILTGTPPDRAASRGALANPESLAVFEQIAGDRSRRHRRGVQHLDGG